MFLLIKIKDKLVTLFNKDKLLAFPGKGEYINIVKRYKINLSEDPIIVEVGSLDCLDAIELQKYYKSKIYSFECNPFSLLNMRKNVYKLNLNNYITIVPMAVTEINGVIDFWMTIGNNPGASSIYKVKKSNKVLNHYKENIQRKIKVKSTRLDTWMNKYSIDKIDLLTIDVQGAELDVLKSLGNNLKFVNNIILEGQYVQYYENTPLIYEINKFLISNGFILKSKNLKKITRKNFNNFYYKNEKL